MGLKLLAKISLLCTLAICVVFGFVIVALTAEWREEHNELQQTRAQMIAQTLLRIVEREDAKSPLKPENLHDFSPELSQECHRLYERHNVSGLEHVAVFAADGVILAHNDSSLVLQKSSNQALVNKLGWWRVELLEDRHSHHILIPVVSSGERTLATIDVAFAKSVYTSEFKAYLTKSLLVLAIALSAISVSVAAIIFWFAIMPMRYLLLLGQRVTQGSFIDTTQFARRKDIFSELGETFVIFSHYLQEVTELAESIAYGRLDRHHVQKRSKRDLLGIALREMLDYLQMVTECARKISEGDLRISIPIRADTDQFGRSLNQMMAYLHKMADAATIISTGDLREEILPRSERDVLGNAFHDMTVYLNRLSSAATTIASGDLKQDVQPATENDVLGNAFHKMAIQLRENFEKIQLEVAERAKAQEALLQLNETLEQRVERRTAEVTRQKYILDSFMANVPDCIYFKDRESRFIRGNKAIADLFEKDDPAELIGKNDFDFFPEEMARPKYEQEQQIIQTGKPLLGIEEPHDADAGGRWMLTTKMPLKDERGEIIGTFGISRDITDIKQAHQRLEDAYLEIRALHDKLRDENLRMSAELGVGRRLQKMALPLPEELRQLEELDIAGFMQPADEVGGDYYDILPRQSGQLYLGIGDVTGHGLESGVLMLMTQTAIRTLIDRGEQDLGVVLAAVNRVLYKNIQRMGASKSLTLSLAHYRDGLLNLVGQHEDVLVVRRGGHVERVDTADLGFPVGMVEDISEWVAEKTVSLMPGDGIVLYTDGITEAEDLEHNLYGLERLCDVLVEHWHISAEEIQKAVIDDVVGYIGEQAVHDDLTLVVMKRQ